MQNKEMMNKLTTVTTNPASLSIHPQETPLSRAYEDNFFCNSKQ